ncbi:YoaK family protein [Kitasatospora sp. LaBMicrA B282]|uniref:YoaK family protein n=1 Tax=Kitasatospora sp. LaBMicrA B282 TaxID=3420949 RepID=UPI003D09A4AB
MRTLLLRAADYLYPGQPGRYGTLPVLLIALTCVTGIVDAVSFLGLRHVFVANMTGNVVFIGFSLAGATDLSLWASALAFAAFVVGAWTAGRVVRRLGTAQRAFRTVVTVQTVLVAGAVVLAAGAGHTATGAQVGLIVLLGLGMGLQNGAVLTVKLPDLTTTVLTRVLTGLVTDPPGRAGVRRTVSILAMLAGAVTGAALLLHVGAGAALGLALALLVGVGLAARL